jgi:hypothetical protein
VINKSRARVASLLAATLVVSLLGVSRSPAADGLDGVRVTSDDGNSHFLVVGRNKSVTVDLPREARQVLVADPKTLTVVMPTSRRAYIIGKDLGESNVYFYDDHDRPIAAFDVNVQFSSPPHEMERYDQPSNVVVVFRGSLGHRYDCTPFGCVSTLMPSDNTGNVEYLTVTTAAPVNPGGR